MPFQCHLDASLACWAVFVSLYSTLTKKGIVLGQPKDRFRLFPGPTFRLLLGLALWQPEFLTVANFLDSEGGMMIDEAGGGVAKVQSRGKN